jgi:hypothetical protein
MQRWFDMDALMNLDDTSPDQQFFPVSGRFFPDDVREEMHIRGSDQLQEDKKCRRSDPVGWR